MTTSMNRLQNQCHKEINCDYRINDNCTFEQQIRTMLNILQEKYHKGSDCIVNLVDIFIVPCTYLDDEGRKQGVENLQGEVMLDRAVIYSRVSTEEQTTANQVDVLSAWAEQCGFILVEIYQEQESAWKAGLDIEVSFNECGRGWDIENNEYLGMGRANRPIWDCIQAVAEALLAMPIPTSK